MVTFQPLEPGHTAGLRLQSIQIHVRDHKRRELPIEDRTLEAQYGGFVLSQSRKGAEEARRLALNGSYGRAAREARIAGRDARVYELGPEPVPESRCHSTSEPMIAASCDKVFPETPLTTTAVRL